MTGYTVHTGSNEKFSGGWDKIFGGKDGAKKVTSARPFKKKAAHAAKKRIKKK